MQKDLDFEEIVSSLLANNSLKIDIFQALTQEYILGQTNTLLVKIIGELCVWLKRDLLTYLNFYLKIKEQTLFIIMSLHLKKASET